VERLPEAGAESAIVGAASRSDCVVSSGEVWAYVVAFSTLVAAGLGAPAPEELVISLAGALAGRLPPEPRTVEAPMAYPAPAEVAGLLAVNPQAGFPGGVPWAALARTAAPRELSREEVAALNAAGLLSVNPQAGFPGGLPWATLAGAGPAVKENTLPADDALHVRWWVMLPVCIAGVVLSDIILYSLGWWGGERLKKSRWMARVLSPQRRQRTEENFHRYGVSILVFGRLVPGIRAPLFLTAGSMRLPLPRFLFADGIGAIVGNSFFFFLGYWLGDSVKTLIERAEERLKPILIIVAVGLLVAYLLWHFLRHPVSTGDPKEVPIIGSQVASHMHHADPSANHEAASDKSAEKKTAMPEDSAAKRGTAGNFGPPGS
jgi:membrane protein DedA with SNARE-associated domain